MSHGEGWKPSTCKKDNQMNVRVKAYPTVAIGVQYTDSLSATFGEILMSLPPPQRLRYERIKSKQDKRDFLAARALTRLLVAQIANHNSHSIKIHQFCTQCRSCSHGRPFIENGGGMATSPYITWSHSRGIVAAATSMYNEVGIDIERNYHTKQHGRSEKIAETQWEKKEALVKLGVITLDEALTSGIDKILKYHKDIQCMGWTTRDGLANVALAVRPGSPRNSPASYKSRL